MSAEKDREPSPTVLAQASAPGGAVFLSYASEDAAAAERIAAALRTVGIEVWFDKSELRGGDAWDRRIREQIHDCRLFIAVISAHTDARDEGYFRREWRLAVERAGDMAEDKAFVVPVAIDGTSERSARVPDPFKHLQWTRLPGGEIPPAFLERVRRLLSSEPSNTVLAPASAQPAAVGIIRAPVRASWSPKRGLLVAVALLVLGALAYLVIEKLWISKPAVSSPTAAASTGRAAFNPPPHSLAVLPFANMSGDASQDYFSDGLTEELLNSLSRINELQVAARTSSFSFQGEHPDIATVAHKLNVGAVLEGSVRRSANTVRITAQLVNGTTGFHLWSETYDRDLGDILKLQTEIATAVASALKVTLLGDEAAKIEVGGTHNPAAFDAYLRATKKYWDGFSSEEGGEAALDAYTEAIRLDPNYALAYSSRSIAFVHNTGFATKVSAVRAGINNAQADARKAVSLAPDLAEGYLALALTSAQLLEFQSAIEEYQRALALAPGNAWVLRNYGKFAVDIGRGDFGLMLLHRALVLDPLNLTGHGYLGYALIQLRRYPEAIAAFKEAAALDSNTPDSQSALIGFTYYHLGDFESARSSCEKRPENDINQICLAMTYEKLGRHADAENMLAKARASDGDSGATEYSAVYAQWGNTARALDWLETSMRVRNPNLRMLRYPWLDPLRNEPRFQAIERALKFPEGKHPSVAD